MKRRRLLTSFILAFALPLALRNAHGGDTRLLPEKPHQGAFLSCLGQVAKLMSEESLPWSGNELRVPEVVHDSNTRVIYPGQTYTTTHVIGGGSSNLDSHLKIVRFANGAFERRGWSADFITGREQVAKDFADRSTYIRVESHVETKHPSWGKQHAAEEGTLQGTIGLTRAESRTLDDTKQIIPMERTLNKQVERFYDSKGRSIVVELRAFAKDQHSEDLVRKAVISDGISMTFSAIKDYPELYDKPVIYTYGDKASVRLYRALGFEIDENATPKKSPIHHSGTDWWILRITPRELEKNLFSLTKKGSWAHNLNQPFPVTLGSGKVALAAPGSSTNVRTNGVTNFFTPHSNTEVAPDLVAAKGARVWLNVEGSPVHIERLGQKGLGYIPEGSELHFRVNSGNPDHGKVERIDTHGAAMTVPGTGLTIKGIVRFRKDGKSLAEIEPTENVEVAPGLIAQMGHLITFPENPESGPIRCNSLTLAKPYTDPETQRMFPVRSSISVEWKNGIPHLSDIRPEPSTP